MVPFTIVKACGLDNAPAKQKQIDIGHYDKGWGQPPGKNTVSRNDIARILAAAAVNPDLSKNLRFDICAEAGTAQDEVEVFKAAMFPWDPRKKSATASVIV